MRLRISSRITPLSLHAWIARARDTSTCRRPTEIAASLTSVTTTSKPDRAQTSAIPEPIKPQPTTPTPHMREPLIFSSSLHFLLLSSSTAQGVERPRRRLDRGGGWTGTPMWSHRESRAQEAPGVLVGDLPELVERETGVGVCAKRPLKDLSWWWRASHTAVGAQDHPI